MKYTIAVEKTFSAAHALRKYRGRCERLHGHNWKVRVSLAGTRLNTTGMLMDFTELKTILDKILSDMDHRFLNEVVPFTTVNPTAEHIAASICTRLQRETVSLKPPVKVESVQVWESETSSATVRP
jgi:6-pyruvoyltetrahydropterin/6-carboxytetrahydropterin synthase